MRLDHLLSKEQHIHRSRDTRNKNGGVAGTQYPTVVLCWLLKELWNYWLWFAVRLPASASTALRGVESVLSGLVKNCSLARCWVLRQHAKGLTPWEFVSGVVFENCRVDASIFVVKLLRAHGGCLGFRSR